MVWRRLPRQLPLMIVREQIDAGQLRRLLPDWAPPPEILHAVFPSRRGQLPSVRALLTYLTDRFAQMTEE